MAEYCCEIQRIENLKIIRGNLKTCKTGAALMAEIAAAVAGEIERNRLNEGEITEVKIMTSSEGYFLVHANGAQDRIFAKVVKA